MTEQLDTAAIRASLDARGTIGPLRTYDLCDALDAARAELMDQSDRRTDAKFYADPELLVRAEAAENEVGSLRGQRAEMDDAICAAEARIAAALTFLDKPRGSGFPYARIAHARRALTGGTE